MHNFLLTGISSASAQSILKLEGEQHPIVVEDEEDIPMMFKFNPDYVSNRQKRKNKIALTKQVIDTLNISENKRRRLLRNLYKNGLTRKLSKILIVENDYEAL